MKNLKKHTTALALVAVVGCALAACGTGPSEERMDQKVDNKIEEMNDDMQRNMDKSRAELTENLRELGEKINKHIAEMDEKLADTKLSAQERVELEKKRLEYKEQHARIEAATSKVGMATKETWNDVEREGLEVKNDLSTWWDRQKENVDQKTDADHDMDGH
ncbi:MAG: hypothetical protein KA408_05915 [Flavobacteriales bacterium]|nr:hypothetical protein [Flavobacteriales bacterium]